MVRQVQYVLDEVQEGVLREPMLVLGYVGKTHGLGPGLGVGVVLHLGRKEPGVTCRHEPCVLFPFPGIVGFPVYI